MYSAAATIIAIASISTAAASIDVVLIVVIHDSGFTHHWLRHPQHNGSHPELHSAAVVAREQSTLTCFVLLDPHVHLYTGPISSTSTHPDLTLLHAEHDPLQHPRRVAPPHPAFEASSFVHVQDEPARHAQVGTVPQPATQAGSPSVTELHHHGTPQASACIHRCGRQIRTHVSARYPAL